MLGNKRQRDGGYLLVLVLVFAGVFMTILTSFVGFIVTQSRVIEKKVQFETAGQIAESGLNYYKWYLAHFPNSNATSTTGVYYDPEGEAIGEYAVTIASTTFCGVVASRQVTSVGYSYAEPNIIRTVGARYARPSVADYSYIINSNVWVGSDAQIIGPYHSNGGIRMDGTNNSVVTSGQSTWTCDSSFGCSPTASKNGVFTTTVNPNTALFDFPSAPINFAGVTVDLSQIKDRAQNGGGLYFGNSGKEGYHVIFLSDGQVEVRRVNSKQGEPKGYAWGRYMHILNGTTLIGRYQIPASCPVVFFEDQIWLEGAVRGNVTLAAANPTSTSIDPSIILNNNITYVTATSGLLAIAEKDVIVGLVVPDNMYLNGVFIAQNGAFGRNHYDTSMPNAWEAYIKRNSLTMTGTIVSNGRVGTKWVDTDTGAYLSGFANRYNSYDRNLSLNPPPFVPNTSDVYQFTDWRDAN